MSDLIRAGLFLGSAFVAYKLVKSRTLRENKKYWDARNTLAIGRAIGIDWGEVDFSVKELARGIVVEMEHGRIDPRTDVTDDDVYETAKIAWAHLNEFPDYYQRLDRMEEEATTDVSVGKGNRPALPPGENHCSVDEPEHWEMA